MASERDVDLEMVQILEQTDLDDDMVQLMKRVIELNPCLSSEERNFLSIAYKKVIASRRNGLRFLSALLEYKDTHEKPERAAQVVQYRNKVISEVDNYCLELISIVDEKLLPEASDAEAKLFYEKLRGDYFRYIAENKEGEAREEFAKKAKDAYERALDVASKEIAPHKPIYLGLILNYSVYLYEIGGEKEQAIALAKKTESECAETVDANSDKSRPEAVSILQLLKDNVALWENEKEE